MLGIIASGLTRSGHGLLGITCDPFAFTVQHADSRHRTLQALLRSPGEPLQCQLANLLDTRMVYTFDLDHHAESS